MTCKELYQAARKLGLNVNRFYPDEAIVGYEVFLDISPLDLEADEQSEQISIAAFKSPSKTLGTDEEANAELVLLEKESVENLQGNLGHARVHEHDDHLNVPSEENVASLLNWHAIL